MRETHSTVKTTAPLIVVVAFAIGFGCERTASKARNSDTNPEDSASTLALKLALDAGTKPECDGAAQATLANSPNVATDRTIFLLEEAYKHCGDGYGLLGAIAQVQLERGNVTEALEAVKREMLAPRSSSRALALAQRMVSELPNAQARVLQELGKTPDAPIHIRTYLADGDRWIDRVTCRGVDPKAYRFEISKDHPKLYEVMVECPPGQQHTVFFWGDERYPPRSRFFTFDKPMPEVSAVLERLKHKFGITNASELAEALLDPSPSRSQAWLLEHVYDAPELVRVWGALLKEDPDDLEAIYSRALEQAAIGDLDGAIATLAHASPETARLRDLRGVAGLLQSSAIRSYECAFLFKERKLEEAGARCKEGLAAGSRVVSNAYLARIALLQGDLPGAESFAKQGAQFGRGREWGLFGVVLSLQGRTDEARPWLQRAAAEHPPVLLAKELLSGVNKRAEDWLLDEEEQDRASSSSALAECGHIYLELGVSDRAATCFRLSERLAFGPAEAQRAMHLSETDAPKALLALANAAKTSHHADVLTAMAVIEHRLGRDREALPWIERALEMWPQHSGANAVLKDVCIELGDAGCATTKQRIPADAIIP